MYLSTRFLAAALMALPAWSCLPAPNDWTGGFEGEYVGKITVNVAGNSNSVTTKGDWEMDTSVRIESATEGIKGWVFGVPECAAVPVVWSAGTLKLDGKPDCKTVDNESATSREEEKYEWRSLTVERSGVDEITVTGKYKEEETETTSTRTTTDIYEYTFKFVGKRMGRE